MKTPSLRAVSVGLGCLVGLTALLGPAAAAAAPSTEIRPATLEKGESGLVPHVDGHALVYAGTRYDFDGREVWFLGWSGDDFVVGTYRQGSPKSHRVLRVTQDDRRTVILDGVSVPELTLSSDGKQVLRPAYRYQRKDTVIRAWSTADGTLMRSRTVKGYADVLDAFDGRAVISALTPTRTFWWDTAADTTTRITDRNGYEADIRQDRLAVVTGDPYEGGCSVVSTLSDHTERLWRSCEQAVVDFSPSGDRVVTTHLLADGLGPSEYQLRRTTGEPIRTYTTYFFGQVLWEADEVLLFDAHGREQSAWVRCNDAGECERTGRLRPTDA